MAHDVFVSYSTQDKAVADAVVAGLEQEGLRCWVAPRDVLPGTSWGEAIVRAIEASRVMVLVLSGDSNRSRQVLREVERAVASGTIILPFRIEAIDPSGAMAYFLATEHWLDALTPPLESHIRRLTATIRALLSGEDVPAPSTPAVRQPQPTVTTERPPWLRPPVLVSGLAIVGLGLAGLAFAFVGGGGNDPGATSSLPPATPTAAASDVAGSPAATPQPSAGGSPTVPPMFDVPTDAHVRVIEAGTTWQDRHEIPEADLVANLDAIVALARAASSEWVGRLELPEPAELGRLAPLALCQLAEDRVTPDDSIALVAGAASKVSRQDQADQEFARWAVSVAAELACPGDSASWAIALGDLGAAVLLSEDFEGDAPGWSRGTFEAGTNAVEGGTFVIEPSGAGYIMGSIGPGTFFDVVVDVWVQQVSGPISMDVGFGVTCREDASPPYGSFYQFALKAPGAFELLRYEADGAATPLAGGASAAIHPSPRANHLTAVCSGSSLAMLANGELLALVEDVAHDEGWVGLNAYSGQLNGVSVRFDELVVREPSPDAISLLDAARGAADH